jgi:hypothetical protein
MARKRQLDGGSNASVRAFEKIATRYIEESCERFPSYASALGLHEFDAELETPSLELYGAHEKLLRQTLSAVEDLPEIDFSGDAWLDRRALLAELRTELWAVERSAFRKNPEHWANGGLGSVHHLVVKHADDLAPVARAILSRIEKLPRYLDGCADLLKQPVPIWQRMAEQTCRGAAGLFDAIREPLIATRKASAAKIDALLGEAKRAFLRFEQRVGRLKPGGAGDFSVGRERFEALIRERLGWELTIPEAEAIARSLVLGLEREMAEEAKRLGRKKSREILERAAADWKPAQGDLLSEYQFETERVQKAFRAADLVTFPKGDRLLVKPVPDFLRHQFPTAAYSAPGAYDPDQTGIFWVNDLSKTRATPRERALEVRQHFGVAATCAHEAYPGHHLQFCTANRHPSKVRRLFAHAVFYEGWTLWVEQMAVDHGVVREPTARLNMLHDALWRAHRILIDCGLHSGRLGYEAAVKHLMRHVGFSRARAEGDVNWYTMSPTVPMSYLLGKTEVLRLKRKKVDQQGWTLKRFNDWALSFGTVPWRWIEQSGL